MNILAFNPGGNSLKVELVQCSAGQRYAFEGGPLLSASIEGIGKTAELSELSGKKRITTEQIVAENYEQANASFLKWWESRARRDQNPELARVDAIAVRVVHVGATLRTLLLSMHRSLRKSFSSKN
jgi:acetate kinase